jgi:hypothetical protein
VIVVVVVVVTVVVVAAAAYSFLPLGTQGICEALPSDSVPTNFIVLLHVLQHSPLPPKRFVSVFLFFRYRAYSSPVLFFFQ